MNVNLFRKAGWLALLFIKEQLKEPLALFWIVISPVVTFYLITYARMPTAERAGDYIGATSWFYAFVSSSVAMFGLAFYIVGRRESGFLRSFVYTARTKGVFLIGQFLAYSCMALVYCLAFYIFTRTYFGEAGFVEFLVIGGRFYVCFLLFSVPALLLTLAPLGFQNANTVFSVVSFMMLALGVVSIGSSHPVIGVVKFINPMWWANQIMLEGVADSLYIVSVVIVLVALSLGVVYKYLLINPVWSRY